MWLHSVAGWPDWKAHHRLAVGAELVGPLVLLHVAPLSQAAWIGFCTGWSPGRLPRDEGKVARCPEAWALEPAWHPFPSSYYTKQVKGQPRFTGEEMDSTFHGSSCENVAVLNLPRYTPSRYMGANKPFFRPLSICLSLMPGSPHGEPVSEFLHKRGLGNSPVGKGWLVSALVFKTDRKTNFLFIAIRLHAEKFTFLVSSSMSADKCMQLY